MATERLLIEISENGARVVKRNIEDIGRAASPVQGIVGKLKVALAALAGAAVIRQVAALAETFTTMQNKLRVVTTDQANLNAVFNELQAVSTRTRSSLEANADLFSRLSLATKDLGVSQREILQFTESLNQAIKISGATSVEAEAGIRQLSQGLASGALRGDELNSILENLPAVADVIAKSLGVTRGELRRLGEQGKISADTILTAFRGAREELSEKFANTAPTVSEGFVLLKNQLLETVGALDQATGGSSLVGGVLLEVTNIIKQITPELVNFTRAVTGTLDPMDELSDAGKVFASIFITIIGVLKSLVNVIVTVVQGAFSTAGKNIGAVAAAIAAIAQGDFSRAGDILKNRFVESIGGLVSGTKDLYGELVLGTTDTIDKLVQVWDKGARQVQERASQAVGVVGEQGGQRNVRAAVDPKAAREIEKLERALGSLLNQINPTQGALVELAEARELLTLANEKGLLSDQALPGLLARAEEAYRDQIDPLGAINRELDEQNRLLGLNAEQRDVEAALLERVNQLKFQGVLLDAEQTQALRARLSALQASSEVVGAQDELLRGSVDRRREFTTQLQAITNLLNDSTSGFAKGDATKAVVDTLGEDLFSNTAEQFQVQADRYAEMYRQIDELRARDLISEQTAETLRNRIRLESQQQQIQTAQTFFGTLAQLQKSQNSKIAAVGKAAAIAQALVSTYTAANNAYASLSGIPYIGPALGAAAAGAAIAAGLANVAQIRSQPTGFMTGGSFTVPGSGGADSRNVMFRASPGERVSIATPRQVRKGEAAAMAAQGSPGAKPPQVNNRIINLVDPSLLGDYLDTPEGEQLLVNTLRRNSDLVRSVVSQG